MPGRVIWTVLMSRQVHTAMALYEGALGWRFEPFGLAPVPGWVARGAENEAMAMFLDTSKSDFPAASEMWLPLLAVARLDERIREVEALGAVLLRPPMEFSGFGRVAVLRQPGGAIVGWMTPASVSLT
jgi:predicted enzyme related to lactoylglutathione lyase